MQPQGTPGFLPGLAREGGRAAHRDLGRAGGHPRGCLCPGDTEAILAGPWSLVHRQERGLWNGHLPGCLWHVGLWALPTARRYNQAADYTLGLGASLCSQPANPNHVTKKFQVDERHGNTTIISEPSFSSKVLPAPASAGPQKPGNAGSDHYHPRRDLQSDVTSESRLSGEPPSLLHLSVLEPKS